MYVFNENGIFHKIIIHKDSPKMVLSVYSLISGLLEVGPPEPVSKSLQSRLRHIKLSLYSLDVHKRCFYVFLINCIVVKGHISFVMMTPSDSIKRI